uniref:Acyl-[acyl-carrier-protein]--UDP-N-acetylglucosamine O-acyltransferase n=1 Tax=Lygus hesperus TaxID=30085 RepID=A0A0A9XWE6_LYGHE
MAESDVTDPDPPSDYDGFDDGDYDSDITEEVIEDDNELMSHACLLSHTSPTADDPKGTKVVASSVISGRMEEANLEILEVCPEITESSDPTFQYLNPVLETPVISSTASFGYISTTNDYIGNNNNSNAVVTVQTPDHCVKESTGRKRSYDDLYDVQPGQWVAISLEDGGVIPAMYIREVSGKVEVKMVTALKSGFGWGEKTTVDSSRITCMVDTPKLREQIGSKSQPKREVLYF